MMDKEKIQELTEALVSYQELLESDKKISIKSMKEILADFNFFMMVILKFMVENGAFDEEVPETPSTMYA